MVPECVPGIYCRVECAVPDMGCLRVCVDGPAAILNTTLNKEQLYAAQPNHTQNTYYYDIYVDSEFLLKMVPPTIMVRRERLFILS